ncbi:DUF805 domain-containing protein [Streptococcus sinensis]|uniref:DUF805 domain-containing protein n=1 Tax=Streptococcus sinensis TaxID=176090 RepID=A0A0A0DJ14_9STRE|nr:DUF805 domain-containing protein [Streptococcus sinensis]KGM38139.1 hypothetical protein SSIN_0082 [Streptococcus sinensis]
MFAAYKKFWVQYADFSGRSSRSDFWWVVLCNFLITLPFSLIALFGFLIPLFSEVYYAGLYDYEPDFSGAMAGAGFAAFIMFLLAIYGFATIVPNLAITVRRLRDAGFHWAFIFLTVGPSIASFIPVLNILAALVSLPCGIAMIVLLCQASKPAQPVNGAPYGQQGFQGQQFGQPQNQQFGQSGFQGQQFGQPQAPVQNQQFGQPQQPVQNQQFGQPGFQGQQIGQPQAPVQNQQFGQPQQPVQNQQFGQSGFQGQPFGQPQAPVENQQFDQPQQPIQNQPFGQAVEQEVQAAVESAPDQSFVSPFQEQQEPVSNENGTEETSEN